MIAILVSLPRLNSCLRSSVPSIGSGSLVTLTWIKYLLDEWLNKCKFLKGHHQTPFILRHNPLINSKISASHLLPVTRDQ